jgi:creatinine amidohydrolase
MTLPEKRKPYVVYYADLPMFPGEDEIAEGKELGHACEVETSVMMVINSGLVKMEQLPRPFHNLQRGAALQEAGAYTQADWYAMYPAMYVGDAAPATVEKGHALLNGEIDMLVRLIRVVKDDTITPALVKEFNARADRPTVPEAWLK